MAPILNSSVVIAGERRGHTVRQILEQLEAAHGKFEMGLSVVTIVEQVHGIQRAEDEQRRARRQVLGALAVTRLQVYTRILLAQCDSTLKGTIIKY